MIETLLLARPRSSKNGIDVKFTGASEGSKIFLDAAGNTWTQKDGGGNSKVVIDPLRGAVWYNAGDGFFTTPMKPSFALSDSNFVIEFEIKTTGSGVRNLGGTGDYNEGVTYGIGLSLNQFPDRWIQAFCMSPAGWDRLYPVNSNTGVWTRAVITRKLGVEIRMDLYRDDVDPTTPYATHSIGDLPIGDGPGYWSMFKGVNTTRQYFSGWISFFRVTKD